MFAARRRAARRMATRSINRDHLAHRPDDVPPSARHSMLVRSRVSSTPASLAAGSLAVRLRGSAVARPRSGEAIHAAGVRGLADLPVSRGRCVLSVRSAGAGPRDRHAAAVRLRDVAPAGGRRDRADRARVAAPSVAAVRAGRRRHHGVGRSRARRRGRRCRRAGGEHHARDRGDGARHACAAAAPAPHGRHRGGTQ